MVITFCNAFHSPNGAEIHSFIDVSAFCELYDYVDFHRLFSAATHRVTHRLV